MAKLDALERSIGGNVADSLTAPTDQPPPGGPSLPERLRGVTKAKNTALIPVTKIVADNDQPRETFEADGLNNLANSIKTHGILQPLLVRWSEEHSYYILIAGERRWRAAQIAGIQSVPCVIREGELDSSARLTLQIIENEMREAIAPLELARGYRRLMDLQDWSAGQLSEQLHIPKSTITRTLELLDLPVVIQGQIDAGSLAPSVAAEIGRLPDKDEQIELAEKVVQEKLPRTKVVEEVRAKKAVQHPTTLDKQSKDKGTNTKAVITQTEIVLDHSCKVCVIGTLIEDNPEAILEILYRAVAKLKAEIAATV